MKVAICGYPPIAKTIVDQSKNIGVECTHFVKDFISKRDRQDISLPIAPPHLLITFFELRKLIAAEQLDGLIVAEEGLFSPTKDIIKICKFYNIPNVGIINFWNPAEPIYWLDSGKAFIPYMETNLIDSCNLNCKGCTHFANLFNENDFYALEDFKRDLRRISETTDVLRLRLMGGEPLLLKNLDQYVKAARQFLPKAALRLVTNGLLVPEAPQKLLDALRENKFVVDISMYKPTFKIFDRIVSTLQKNGIMFQKITGDIETFSVILSLQGNHDPLKSRNICGSNLCRFLRDGKIYKCPMDALSFRFSQRFNLKHFPAPAGIDIFTPNFSSMLDQLEGNVELCNFCNETSRQITWKPENNPKLEDWLANPEEMKLLESIN